ncbi:hypothetical protein PBY51_006166 [Eleginops maclovinus]|uniref:Uncharacterized protein n=1 Tax=Eleginops maclovinus TaxID=56733 RepID=A0AAN8AA97_ELEMC|nr:hypothetical protein PBY51_006166 [Eleginops maclovinus]
MSHALGGWATHNHIVLISSTKTHNKLGHGTAASTPASALPPPVRVPKREELECGTHLISTSDKHTDARTAPRERLIASDTSAAILGGLVLRQ